MPESATTAPAKTTADLLAEYANYDQCAMDWIEAADGERADRGPDTAEFLAQAAVFAQLATAAATAALAARS